MQADELLVVSKCAHVHECMLTKVCHFGTPDRAQLRCMFYERHIKVADKKLESKVNKRVMKFENSIWTLIDQRDRKVKDLKSRIRKISNQFEVRIQRKKNQLEKFLSSLKRGTDGK